MKTSRYQLKYPKSKAFKAFTIIFMLSTTLLLWYIFYWRPRYKIHKIPFHVQRTNLKPNTFAFNSVEYANSDESGFTGDKIVHLDLKGAPPKISYYATLLPLLSSLGATGLLIEYEDMFPYEGPQLENVSALNAYTLEDVKTINKLAEQSHLTVIPLVQTFGHLEFLLKLAGFENLREIPQYPQVICPTHTNTLNIISDMLEQIIRAHPASKLIHIGADEVYFIGQCERCLETMNKYSWSRRQLFVEHIGAVARKIKERHPEMRVLVWDDMFRAMSLNELKNSHVGKIIEPVVWKYTKEVYEDLGPSLWDMYAEVFPKVWAASAFKGATGSNKYVTDVAHHVQNHRSWLSVISEYRSRLSFQGIFITGWQRYDHFAVLCELLPVAIPSLAMCLRLLNGHDDSPLSPPTDVARLLQCEQPYALIGPAFGSPRCGFAGADVLEGVLKLAQLAHELEAVLDDSRVRGWIAEYNVASCQSSPQLVEGVLEPIERMLGEVEEIRGELERGMGEVYDNYTIDEWLRTYLVPVRDKVRLYADAKSKLLGKSVWGRRPILDGC